MAEESDEAESAPDSDPVESEDAPDGGERASDETATAAEEAEVAPDDSEEAEVAPDDSEEASEEPVAPDDPAEPAPPTADAEGSADASDDRAEAPEEGDSGLTRDADADAEPPEEPPAERAARDPRDVRTGPEEERGPTPQPDPKALQEAEERRRAAEASDATPDPAPDEESDETAPFPEPAEAPEQEADGGIEGPAEAPAGVGEPTPPPDDDEIEEFDTSFDEGIVGGGAVEDDDYGYDPGFDDDGDGFDGGPPDDEEMPLADHIEEMVNRLGIVIVALGVVTILAYPFSEQLALFVWEGVMPVVTFPDSGLQAQPRPYLYGPLEKILTQIKVASLSGILIALPLFVYQTYRFMRPGLYTHERRYYLASVPSSLVLAALGMAFSYFVVLPGLFEYFAYYSQEVSIIAFGLEKTFSLIVTLTAFLAVVFQIPVFIMLGIMMGVTTRRWLEQKRLYFWAGFLGVAGITYSIDPTGMTPIVITIVEIALFEGTLALLRWTSSDTTGESMEARRPYAWTAAAVLGAGAYTAEVTGLYGLDAGLPTTDPVWALPVGLAVGGIVLFEALLLVIRRTGR